MFLDVAPKMLEIGLSAAAIIARNVDNTRTVPELIAYRRAQGERLATYWRNRSISAHPVVSEYHRVHQQFGALSEQPAPEKLITYVRRNRDFTASGAVVDCYNIVSARTLLSIGAHDLDKVALPVTLRATTPQDVFVPLGEIEPQSLPEEYAYVDSQGSIICRLDVLQCEQTKTARESREMVFFLQGNRCLPATLLLKGVWLLSEMVTRFCGGVTELVSFFDAGAVPPTISMKPHISFETFKHLNLQKGIVIEAKPLTNLAALSTVIVQTKRAINTVALSSALSEQVIGKEVVVATNLHPLVIGGETFTSYLPILHRESLATHLQVDAAIPNGQRLY